ncbi:hypothetical protein GCM10023093_11790 [Nemorincola caseinilytica]|uniref:3-dehydroquinate synthase n=2 Tax=Nemorincola caseinilytica TaxID=2054315 RepID=A0ABP8NC09_9BACT
MQQAVILTDEHIAALYPHLLKDLRVITIPAGEDSKSITTIARLTKELLEIGATRDTLLIGMGGGVVTDITGFLAAVFMRGIRCGFVPTTLLAMADAAVGGKNGVNNGMYKNMIGTIRQPEFILYDIQLLQTLPQEEWSNGFAEVIKYGCIFDAGLFDELAQHDLAWYMQNNDALNKVIERCVAWKNRTVAEDEHEKGIRKLLNFGHTAGHAIEKLYALPHGKAVAIGMMIACHISEQQTGLDAATTQQLEAALQRYHLPVHMAIDTAKVMALLQTDKKRKDDSINYILLQDKGKAVIHPLRLPVIEKALASL